MCDYSILNVKTRPAVVGEKLVTHHFPSGTTGFADPADCGMAVCVLPGTELAFDGPVSFPPAGGMLFRRGTGITTARFQQLNRDLPHAHHDVLELADGQVVYLTALAPGQTATVLQLPAAPQTRREAQEQRRVETVG